MSWYQKHIRAGQLFRSTNIYYKTSNLEPVPLNTIVMIIDLETIAGNVSYLIEDKKYRMDASSFLGFFERIAI